MSHNIGLIKQILSESTFNLSDINSRIERSPNVHQDFSFKQLVLSSQNVEFNFTHSNTICYISKLMTSMCITFVIDETRSEIKDLIRFGSRKNFLPEETRCSKLDTMMKSFFDQCFPVHVTIDIFLGSFFLT